MPYISTTNSTKTLLSANSTFTGISESLTINKGYDHITVSIISDQDSASGGVSLQFSSDSSNWDYNISYTYKSTGYFFKRIPIYGAYYRIVYTNGSTNQTSFRLQSLFIESDDNKEFTFPDNHYDAFFRIRVSNPYTILDIKHIYDKNASIISEKITNNGTSTFQTNKSAILMAVTDNLDSVVRQSRRYCVYQPGKSMLILMTGILNNRTGGNQSNVTTQLGFFDSQNGIFFRYNNGTTSVVLRSYVTGAVVDTIVNSNNWNIDKMNGTGNSGITLDVSKANIYIIDLEWLGVGRVRTGIIIKGQIYYVHEFLNANNKTSVYMTSAILPIRYEIISSGSGNNNGEMLMICSTVMSEGGYNPIGKYHSVNNGITSIIVTNTETPLLSIRLKPTRARVNVKLASINVISISNANLLYNVRKYLGGKTLPYIQTPTSGFTSVYSLNSDIDTSSAVEFNSNFTSASYNNQQNLVTTDSIVIYSGYVTDNTDSDFQALFANTSDSYLTSDVDGNSDTILISATKIGSGNENVLASITWYETD
jgi:hypothetical protein